MIIACTSNDQANDAARRLGQAFPQLSIDRFMASGSERPEHLHGINNVSIITATGDLSAPVTVATSAKYSQINNLGFQPDYLFVDEAYQLKKADHDRIRGLAGQTMLIGDLGRLIRSTKPRFGILLPTQMGRTSLRRTGCWPNAAHRYNLPVSRRLPQDTVALVQPAFYATMPFRGLADAGERRLDAFVAGATPTDFLLDRCLAAGSLSLIALRPEQRPAVDPEVIGLTVDLVRRLIFRRYMVQDDDGEQELRPESYRYRRVPSRTGRRTKESALEPALQDVHVETANRFQGLERKVILALHPLSGLRRADRVFGRRRSHVRCGLSASRRLHHNRPRWYPGNTRSPCSR